MPKKSASYAVRIPWDEAQRIIGSEEELRRRAKTGLTDYKRNGVPSHIVALELLVCWRERHGGVVQAAGMPPLPPQRAVDIGNFDEEIAAFVAQLDADERRAFLGIGPSLLKIYRAQKGGRDDTARRAWDYIVGNIKLFARGLDMPPPRKQKGNGF